MSTEPDAPVDPKTGESLAWRSPAVVIVLFDREAPSGAEAKELLEEVFEGSFEVATEHETDPETGEEASATTVEIDGGKVYVIPNDVPVAEGQAEQAAQGIALWNGGEGVVAGHRSHVVVAGFADEPDLDDDAEGAGSAAGENASGDADDADSDSVDPRTVALRTELGVAQVAATLTALPGAVAVFVAPAMATLPAGPYRDLVVGHPLPVPALVGVRAGMQGETQSCVFTTGLGRFGRHEMERADLDLAPGDAFAQMCDLVSHLLGSGVVFGDGTTLEIGDALTLECTLGQSRFGPWQALDLTESDRTTAPESGT